MSDWRPLSPEEVIARLRAEGLNDEEIVDYHVRRGRPALRVDEAGHLELVPGASDTLHQQRILREWLAVNRKPRKDPAAGPIATPEQARSAYAEHGSDRKAAAALGISKTQLRRLLGKNA